MLSRMCPRDSPTSFGPVPTRPRTFVATITSLRRGPSARPRISSARPFEYVSALSKKLMPMSRQTPTRRSASDCAVWPMALYTPSPPNVIVPKQISDTRSPVRPKDR